MALFSVIEPAIIMEPPFSRTQSPLRPAGLLPARPAEETRMNRIITVLALLLAFAPGLARAASQQASQVLKNWKTGDNCAKQAQAAFPDFTVEANAKRDAKLKECLEANRLAPREPGTPGQ
jgi:hypothetical protein